MQTLQAGENLCQLLHDAESLLFDSDDQVQSFIELIKTGNLISDLGKLGHVRLGEEKVG
jgi:hypothetical protein